MKHDAAGIQRTGGNGRRSTCAAHDGVLYTSGITTVDLSLDAAGQANDIFNQLDRLMAVNATSKHNVIHATVQLKTMEDFAGFNSAWDLWVDDGFEPALTIFQSPLPLTEYRVQVSLIVAL